MAAVRIAVAGAGLIGRRHIEEVMRHRGSDLAAIVDPSEAAAHLARTLSVPLHGSLRDLLAAGEADGVILATPNQLHLEQGLACIAAGMPVLIEKPVVHSYAEGVTLCDIAETAGAKVLVGHHRRHSPILAKAVEIVGSGVLGKLVAVMGSAVFYKPADYHDGPFAWRRKPGGGPILINMIHEIDNLRAMVGEIAAVQAMASNAIRGFEVEDTVAINLHFTNGALGSFLLSDTAACPRSWEQTSGENEAYAHYPDEDAYTIMGTDGSLSVPTMRLRLYRKPEERSWYAPFTTETHAQRRQDPLALQIAHFAAVIRGEAEPLVTCRDGLQNLRITDAIAEAARTGNIVTTL